MDEIRQKLIQLLVEIDNLTEPTDELAISQKIKNIGKDEAANPMEFVAEMIALDLHEAHTNSTWNLYYGPMFEGTSEDGSVVQYPSLNMITSEIISYWMKRADESNNYILKARYADLVWEFTRIVIGNQPNIEYAYKTIDSIINLANSNLYSRDIWLVKKLKRALLIALQTNDQSRIERIKTTILSYEVKVAVDDKPGLWGFSFDLLIDNKKIKLSDEEKNKILTDLENRLSRVTKDSEDDSFNPWAAEAATERLAKYYRKHDKTQEVFDVLLKYGNSFVVLSDKSTPLQASSWLQRLYAVYSDYGLKDEADKILKKIRELGPKMNAEMKAISHTFEIPSDQMNDFINFMTEGTVDKALYRVTVRYIQRREQVKDQLHQLSKEAPLSFFITKKIHDHKGRLVASIGSLEEDENGNIVRQMSENFQIEAIFLRAIIEKMVEKFELNEDVLLGYLYESPGFDELKRNIIHHGLKSYFMKDYLVAIHLLVPQIEDALRRILEFSGGTILKQSRGGSGFHYKNLDELLRDEKLEEVFGEDALLYFRVVLTDQRGWNVRNDVCHGIVPQDAFGVAVADRLIHILLCLAAVRDYSSDA